MLSASSQIIKYRFGQTTYFNSLIPSYSRLGIYLFLYNLSIFYLHNIANLLSEWRDSNPYAFRHQILSLACLPFPAHSEIIVFMMRSFNIDFFVVIFVTAKYKTYSSVFGTTCLTKNLCLYNWKYMVQCQVDPHSTYRIRLFFSCGNYLKDFFLQ